MNTKQVYSQGYGNQPNPNAISPPMANGQINGPNMSAASGYSSQYSQSNTMPTRPQQFAQNQARMPPVRPPYGQQLPPQGPPTGPPRPVIHQPGSMAGSQQPPRTMFQPPPTSSPYGVARPLAQMANSVSGTGMFLPPPYANQQFASTPSPIHTPHQSAPHSSKSSRNPSPLPNTSYDVMEGQFPSNTISPSPSSNSLVNTYGAANNGMPITRQPGPHQVSRPQTNGTHADGQQPQSQFANRYPSSSVPQRSYQNGPYAATPPSMPTQQPPSMPTQQPPSMPTQQPPPAAARRQYPQMQHGTAYNSRMPMAPAPSPGVMQGTDQLSSQLSTMNIYGGSQSFNILQNKNVLPQTKLADPQPPIPDSKVNCRPEVFRCTLNSLPETQKLLEKVRLPLGILIHPFKDLSNLPVIQCSAIVRCRSCRTYINPFVYFVDQRKWKCNLCFKVNELPEEFLYDPISKQYGDPSRRPEVKSSTIEFIAPSEYMLRPPQPAVYLFLLDVTSSAIATGYLDIFCDTLMAQLDNIPGDARTQIGFITYDSCLHFYNLAEGLSQPQMMVVSDVDDVFLPSPDNLLVNLNESKELIRDLVAMLSQNFKGTTQTGNALGAALQVAYKLMAPTGGRVTVVNTCLPNLGPGLLKSREDPNQRAAQDVENLGPANDFYKKLSLDCSGQQIAVDLFVISSQYTDMATLSCISKFSGGCIYHYPALQSPPNHTEATRFMKDLSRYLTRKIGFEAVMRVRCTRGISIHSFHGNFFVRSTDLLSLPNINPDAAFAMQMSLEESLADFKTACFQAALLYTSTKGERRIRVHTLCLPITSSISDVIANADQMAIASLVAKMAVDRSLNSSMADAREAMINVIGDALSAFKTISPSGSSGALMVPMSLRLLPLYILAILKSVSLRVGTSTKLDDRVYAMNQTKTLPMHYYIQSVYPDMYPVHALENCPTIEENGTKIAQPPLLHLSSERTDRHGAYLLDAGKSMYLYVCSAISDLFCNNILGVDCFAAIPNYMIELPQLDNPQSVMFRSFVQYLNSKRPFYATLHVIRDDNKMKGMFLQNLVEDRTESTYSYYEFLQHIHQQLDK